MKKIISQRFDEERALYNSKQVELIDCTFAGPADGESALKESSNISMSGCSFSLRYPLWHVNEFSMEDCTMDEFCRAAIWYSGQGRITRCMLGGIKAVRECHDIMLIDSRVVSPEFGWKSNNINLINTSVESEYLFFDSQDITLDSVKMKGKYSFQYVKNLVITDSNLDTKDAFWHSRNVTVKDSVVKGEYLGWFSENLCLENCHIIGTQPLCYCKGLKLINCTMEGCDLSFEYSEVEATIAGHVDSIKNPKSGLIVVDSVGEVVHDDPVMECIGRVEIRQ